MNSYRQWHRRLGLSISSFLILFIISGILLQYSTQLAFDQRYVPASLAQSLYGISIDTVKIYSTTDQNILQVANFIYLEDVYVPYIRLNELRGVVTNESGVWIAGDGDLWLLSPEGELLDKFSTAEGLLPEAILKIGFITEKAHKIIVINGLYQKWYLAEDSLSWQPYLDDEVIWSTAISAETVITERYQSLLDDAQGRLISWERFLLDFHSGRLFGGAGTSFVSIISLLMLLATTTGIIMWLRY